MKKLILLQGASGTGKSSWIRDHHVQCYTISADDIRQRLGLAVHTRRGNMPIIKIKNHDDTITWDIFNKIINYYKKVDTKKAKFYQDYYIKIEE